MKILFQGDSITDAGRSREKTGTIELESHGQNEEIHVSPEDYAQVLEYITFKPKRRRKTASKTTKKQTASTRRKKDLPGEG